MRSFFIFIAAILLANAGPAAAQSRPQQSEASAPRTYTQADLWNRGGNRITFTLAGISLPLEAGAVRFDRAAEASREGQGLDNAIVYLSADREVFATVYIYAPAFPDAALTAFMTDHVIGVQSGSELRRLGANVIAAGGREGVAIRADYAGFRDSRLASSAAFIRVDRWILKVRVSGPEGRRADVERTMTALLSEMRFEGRVGPAPVALISAQPCADSRDRAAQPVPTDSAATMEDAILAHVIGVTGDADSDEPGPPPARPSWCRSQGFGAPGTTSSAPILRDPSPGSGDDTRRSVLIALVNDAGTMFEVVERRFRGQTRYVLVHHQIGRTMILGAYDSVPTDAQIARISSGEDRQGGNARASITYQAGGDSNVTLHVPLEPARPST